MSTYRERLLSAMQSVGINQTELAKRVSVVVGRSVTPQAIQYLVSESKEATGSRFTTAIARVIGVDAEWLASGGVHQDAEFSKNPNAAKRITSLRHEDGDHYEQVPISPQNYKVVVEKTKKRVPVINSIPAGGPKQIIDDYHAGAGMDELEVSIDVSDYAFALVLEGDSMSPEFRDGDKVVIDPGLTPMPGDFVAAKCHGDHGTFKKFRPRGRNEQGIETFDLVPLNEDYATLHETEETCSIAGVMVEHHKYYRRRGR